MKYQFRINGRGGWGSISGMDREEALTILRAQHPGVDIEIREAKDARGRPPKETPMTRMVAVSVDAPTHARWHARAKEEKLSLSEMMRRAMSAHYGI